MDTLISIQDKIRRAPELNFSDIFSKSIDLFKIVWVQGLLLQLFSIIVILPIILILYAPILGLIISQSENGEFNPETLDSFFAGMSILYILFLIVGFLVLGAVVLAIKAAFYRIVMKMDHNQSVSTSDFFYFLKGKYLSKTLALVLISMLIGTLAVILCVLPVFYVMVPLSFFSVMLAFNPELSTGDIISASFSLGNKKWLLVFGLMIVIGLILTIINYMTCGIGNLFLTAFMYLPLYLVYKQVVGFEDTSEINNIGQIEE
ncbi:MAG: hypothetical protein KJO41_08330 [Bacteroidia bacterium]|nr:hypothetical protein [Bacteroidia bacterium]NND26467.1 hypothetical protein [Flavobacteriaceae bacterium]MBT8278994.1 hypothetical protein [Bacteroidia bacterium]NNK59988.1 hypothetical protein [Flavobacteriaceae bacterium]NNL33028.1 hypothetical protein [Flavobacteriaceae bacterium]